MHKNFKMSVPGKKEVLVDVLVPCSVFKDRRMSPFEALVKYLKENERLSFKEISVLLNRDTRNIWTVYNRGKRKI